MNHSTPDLYRLHCLLLGLSLLWDKPPSFGPCDDPDLEWVRLAMLETSSLAWIADHVRAPLARLGGPSWFVYCMELAQDSLDSSRAIAIREREVSNLLRELRDAEDALYKEILRVTPYRDRFDVAKGQADRWLASQRPTATLSK